MEKLVLIGAGGYAKSVIDSIDIYNYKLEGFIDEFTDSREYLGYPILSNTIESVPEKENCVYFISIGNNENRKRWYDKIVSMKLRLINIVDKSAIVSPQTIIGTGCFIGKFAVVNSKSEIGNDVIINTRALVEHGCIVHQHANLSTNSVINGDVEIGEGSFIGSCSVTIGQKKIGNWSTVGAGAVVISNVEDGVTVAGVPAKIIKRGAMLG